VKVLGRPRGTGLKLAAGISAFLAILAGLILVADVAVVGSRYLSWHFFGNFASRFAERAGIRAPLAGTVWLLGLTASMSVPVAVGAALYLEEYAPRNWMTRAFQSNITILAGVPSIVYGILGLAFFVRGMGLGRSVLAGALTLALLIMPQIILSTQESLRAVPPGIREAAYALGATRWQVIRHQVLPMALPGIVSGGGLALTRAIGETAPLVLVGAVAFIAFTPVGVTDPFTALPVQIFDWVTRPQGDFQGLAAAAILVLLAIILGVRGLTLFLAKSVNRSL